MSPSLIAEIRAHLDRQEEIGWHLDWPEALHAIRAVLDLHPHHFYNRYGVRTEDVTQAVDGRCDTCGNVYDGGIWCPTVRAIARTLGIAEEGAR